MNSYEIYTKISNILEKEGYKRTPQFVSALVNVLDNHKVGMIKADEENDDYVDLGLPSGTLWAKCNYGAKYKTENGGYYAFEEAQKLPITLPTKEQFKELIKHTESKWVTIDNVNGRLLISKKNGNSIFLPASGLFNRGDIYDLSADGYYWSSNLNTSGFAWRLIFCGGYLGMDDGSRYYGLQVRSVKTK